MTEFPSRVWAPTKTITVDGEELTLYASTEPSDEDRKRRKLYKHEAEKRLDEMKDRILLEERRQREQDYRRRG